jgi:glycosyltransferase involved in cell wall biosynthesis
MKPFNVTVLIPTFNRSAFLLESLDSILAQTRPAHEIIIINDGSTDDTLEQLKAYEGRVRVLSKSNAGKSAALNFGLKHVTGDLVWIFDDDDLAAPKALEILVGLLEANPEADMAYGRHERFSVDGSGDVRLLGTGYWTNCESDEFLTATLDDMFAHQQGMVVRKELYDRVGAFDESLVRSQDYDMLIRLARVGTPVSTEEFVFKQRVHDGIRGTQTEQVQAKKRNSSWSQFDKVIFRNFYPQIKLNEYLSDGRSISDPLNKRHALLRRASVMARKKLWELAIKDLRAAESVSLAPLSKPEKVALRSSFASKYGCDEILTNSMLIDELCELAEVSLVGAEIVLSLARGLRWRVRSEFTKIRCLNSVSYFLIMTKLKRAASMTITAKSPLSIDRHESQSASHF